MNGQGVLVFRIHVVHFKGTGRVFRVLKYFLGTGRFFSFLRLRRFSCGFPFRQLRLPPSLFNERVSDFECFLRMGLCLVDMYGSVKCFFGHTWRFFSSAGYFRIFVCWLFRPSVLYLIGYCRDLSPLFGARFGVYHFDPVSTCKHAHCVGNVYISNRPEMHFKAEDGSISSCPTSISIF